MDQPTQYQRDTALENVFQQYEHEMNIMRQHYGDGIHDIVLYRFLKAFKYDTDEARRSVEGSIEYKGLIEFDHIVEELKEMKLEDFPHYDIIHPFLYERGNPVTIADIGRIEPIHFMGTVSEENFSEFMKYAIAQKVNNMHMKSLEQGNVVREFRIIDLEGLGMVHLSSELLRYLTNVLSPAQSFFPEHLYKCYIINAPRITSIGWAVIKNVLSERTQKKIKIMSSGYENELLQWIPAENLPVKYGGLNEEPIFEDAYADFNSVSVKAGSTHFEEVDVIAGTVVKWTFKTMARDIGFAVSVGDSELHPMTRVESHRVVQIGNFVCESDSTIVFTWDNSYSSWISKELIYRVKISEEY